jgi:NAD(P)-dependent dehydrogenase (short-subunit alcohol dehydrogenase family)
MQGKVVLVTGAARRIGRAIALDLASHGAQVAVHYRSSKEEARTTANEVNGKEFQADLSDVSQITRLFDQVHQRFGRLDCLVNNAALYFKTPLLEATEQEWDRLHDANLKAVYFCTQAAARIMLPRGGGRIVNLSSMGGLRPWSGYAPYNASKAGVVHLTRSLAKELAPTITVNSVAPGVIEFSDEHEPEVQRMIDATPLRRHGTGEEIAEAVRFFLDGPGFVTGQVLAVDGGLTLKT